MTEGDTRTSHRYTICMSVCACVHVVCVHVHENACTVILWGTSSDIL